MKKTFIIASTGDRCDGLCQLLISLTPFFQTGWQAAVVCQGYSDEDAKTVKIILGGYGKCFFLKDLIGAHSAKMIALTNVQSDIWCSLDDDMCAIPETHYNEMADTLMERKDMGFLSGNWARTSDLAKKKKCVSELVSQKLVFTGGGLMFRDDVAEIIRNIPNEQYLFDDCLWAMYAYINGYSNYRYLGSIAIHRICTKGGRKTWLRKTNNRILPPTEYLVCRKCNDLDGYYMCVDKDLTDLAHQKHKENKRSE